MQHRQKHRPFAAPIDMIRNRFQKWRCQLRPCVQTYMVMAFLNSFVFINIGFGQHKNGLQFLTDKKIISFQNNETSDTLPAELLNYFLYDTLWQTNIGPNANRLIFTGKKSQAAAGVSALIGRQKKIIRPGWIRPLMLDTVKISLKPFGTSFFIYKQKLTPDYPAINFNQFVILDSPGHSLTISGKVYGGEDTIRSLDIEIATKDFLLMNVTSAANNRVFGKARVEVDLKVTGNSIRPLLQGSFKLNDETNLTFVLPEKNSGEASAKSVVQFIEQDSVVLKPKKAITSGRKNITNVGKYFKESLDIRADKNASFKILIDPNSGDFLQVKGAAKLVGGIDSTGQILLTGNYEPDSGYYELNSQFLNKRFNLLPASRIEFNGRPADAKMNIRAVYTIHTSPKNLLGNEVGSVNRRIANSFNRELPFNVILFLKGTLSNPAISFDIQLPDSNKFMNGTLKNSINNKLMQLRSDISGINKQVFALLAMGRFVGEQSTDFFKGNDAGLSDVAQESVSTFLASVLDHLASDLFKGINADLNLTSYQDFASSDALQQELNVELSKSFLNDRLSVTAGKNFGIESIDGSAKAAQQKGSRFLPDVTSNFKLSADGKYLLRSYTKNQFEVILDGYVMETGLAFLVTMDFEKFEELFLKKAKKSGN